MVKFGYSISCKIILNLPVPQEHMVKQSNSVDKIINTDKPPILIHINVNRQILDEISIKRQQNTRANQRGFGHLFTIILCHSGGNIVLSSCATRSHKDHNEVNRET